MSGNKQDTDDNLPPNLSEVFEKIKKACQFSGNKNNKKTATQEDESTIKEIAHSCSKKDSDYFIDLLIKCKKCNTTVKTKTIKHPYIVAMLLLVASCGSTYIIDDLITDNRYPLAIEHEIISSCTSAHEAPIAHSYFIQKTKICLCSLEDTMNEVSYHDYRNDETLFLTKFKENAYNCNSKL